MLVSNYPRLKRFLRRNNIDPRVTDSSNNYGWRSSPRPLSARESLLMYSSFSRFLRDHWVFLLAGGFALVWILHRAMVQSITLDEANTYLYWVAPEEPAHWRAHSNNHVLNSALMRLAIWMGGLSHLTMRAPALLGGLLYLAGAAYLCRQLTAEKTVQGILYVALTYNPFVMDYLVAARGYGLAIGFLIWELALLAKVVLAASPNHGLGRAAALSGLAALSFCANFSWAYANAALVACGVFWILRREAGASLRERIGIVAAALIPGALVTALVCGATLLEYPRDQLFWGATSFRQMWNDMRDSVFSPLNPYLVNPWLGKLLFRLPRATGWYGAVLGLFVLAWRIIERQVEDPPSERRWSFALTVAGVMLASLFAHWIQFRLFHIPLQQERTSLFLVPLTTVLIGTLLTLQAQQPTPKRLQTMARGGLAIAGLYFLGCLRDSYFREWTVCADIQPAYTVLTQYCQRMGIKQVVSHPDYSPSLNFYRILDGRPVFDEVAGIEPVPRGQAVYVLPQGRFQELIQEEKLQVLFRGRQSDFAILVRPGAGKALGEH